MNENDLTVVTQEEITIEPEVPSAPVSTPEPEPEPEHESITEKLPVIYVNVSEELKKIGNKCRTNNYNYVVIGLVAVTGYLLYRNWN